MNRTQRVFTALVAVTALALAVSPRALAQEKPKTPSGVAGNWSIAVASPDGQMAAGLSLKQDGPNVTGTFTSEHTGEVAVEGRYVDATLTFTIPLHGGTDPAMKVDFTGKMKADGTLAGSLTGPMGDLSWTASRVK
jgi:hypothetical protein